MCVCLFVCLFVCVCVCVDKTGLKYYSGPLKKKGMAEICRLTMKKKKKEKTEHEQEKITKKEKQVCVCVCVCALLEETCKKRILKGSKKICARVFIKGFAVKRNKFAHVLIG